MSGVRGSVQGVLWALVRILRGNRWMFQADIIVRLWLSILILYYVYCEGVPFVFMVFFATEFLGIVIGIIFFPYFKKCDPKTAAPL